MTDVLLRTGLTIRPLTIEELPLCEPYGRAFHAEKDVPGEFSIETFVKNWTEFLSRYNGIMLGLWDGETLVGGLGGIVCPDLTTGIMTANEFFLFVDETHRGGTNWIKLVNQFREFGRSKGAQRLRLARMVPKGEDPLGSRLDRAYRRIWKVRPVEVGYDGPI